MLYYISVFNMIKLTFARALALKRNGFQKIYYGEIDVKRDTIIKTATALFNEKSYNSIGVDRIIAESMLQR